MLSAEEPRAAEKGKGSPHSLCCWAMAPCCSPVRITAPQNCKTHPCPDLVRYAQSVWAEMPWVAASLPFSTSCLQRRAHSVSCCAYAFSMRARSCRQFMRSLHRRWPSSIRFTVRL